MNMRRCLGLAKPIFVQWKSCVDQEKGLELPEWNTVNVSIYDWLVLAHLKTQKCTVIPGLVTGPASQAEMRSHTHSTVFIIVETFFGSWNTLLLKCVFSLCLSLNYGYVSVSWLCPNFRRYAVFQANTHNFHSINNYSYQLHLCN